MKDRLTGKAPDTHKPGLDSLGGSFQRERTKQATAASGLFGGTSAKVTVDGKTTLIGGVVGASSPDALEFSTGSLETQDLDNRSESIGLGGTITFKKDGKGGVDLIPAGDFSKSDKESTTHATVTEGTVEVDGVEVTELPSVNRDIARIEEVRKDESYEMRIYIPSQSVTETVNEIKEETLNTAEAIVTAVNTMIENSEQQQRDKVIEQRAIVTRDTAAELAKAPEFKEMTAQKQADLIEAVSELNYISQNLQKVQELRTKRGQEVTQEDLLMVYSGAAVEDGLGGIQYRTAARQNINYHGGVSTGETERMLSINFYKEVVEAKQDFMHTAAAGAEKLLDTLADSPNAIDAIGVGASTVAGGITGAKAGSAAGGAGTLPGLLAGGAIGFGVGTKNVIQGHILAEATPEAVKAELTRQFINLAEAEASGYKKVEPTYNDTEAYNMGLLTTFGTVAAAATALGIGGKIISDALKKAKAHKMGARETSRATATAPMPVSKPVAATAQPVNQPQKFTPAHPYDIEIKPQSREILEAMYQGAVKGGTYKGEYDRLVKLNDEQLEKSLRSYKKNVEAHKGYIRDPKSKAPDWDQFEPDRKPGLIEKWRKDMKRAEIYEYFAQQELRKRGK
jgi:hypothetical protein